MKDQRVTFGELVRIVEDNNRMTREIHRALFVGDPEHKVPSLFTRVEFLERDQDEKGMHRAMVAIGTVVGAAVGAITSVSAFFGGHRQ